jgi:pimeloyl-ACP methyl ester carboxylesterase
VIDETRLTYRVFGTPGASRLVVLVGSGMAVAVDPSPAETAAYDVCILAVTLTDSEIVDPGGYGSETPAEQTAASLVELVGKTLLTDQFEDGATTPRAGMIIYRHAADVGLRAASTLGATIDRLVLVAVPAPEQPLGRDDLGALLEPLTAPTLILNGEGDEPAADASWYAQRLAAARVAIVPEGPELSLAAVWGQALSHAAPGASKRSG